MYASTPCPTSSSSPISTPAGDQPEAIAALVDGRRARRPVPDAARHHRLGQELHDRQRDRQGAAARRSCWRPTRALAAQLAAEFRELFPKNRVEYFVSYYDYYQPEAYLPTTDTYIEKDSSINDEIDRLRHSATSALLSRRDVIIVASVSAIYGLGSPEKYATQLLMLDVGEERDQRSILRRLVELQYERNDFGFTAQQVPRARRHDRGVPRLRGARRSASRSSATRSSASQRSTRSPARSSRSSRRSCCSRRRTTSPTDERMVKAIEGIETELAERLA